jgi:hypothetical protein
MAKFTTKGIIYTLMVDYKQKCDYYFANLFIKDGNSYAAIKDCKDKLIGQKNMGTSLNQASNEDKATLLFYALTDIINNPSANNDALLTKEEVNETEEADNNQGIVFDPSVSEHDSRYFFAPSARPLKKGELYYNTIYFLIHDVQYGITDRFSFGMGTTIIGFPFYFTTKYAFPINDKSYFAIGDLLILGTYGADFVGNLLFASYTYGGSKSNITLGGGLLTSNNREVTSDKFTFVTNVNGLLSIGKYFYLISENYISPLKQERYTFRFTTNPDGIQEGNFIQENAIWFGISGVRFVTKKNSLASFQFGLTHILNVQGDIPSPYNQPQWETYESSGLDFIAFPTVSFTRKFKLK